ncbi:hypothetical protein [Brotaphodocola sp.]|uniref:hypothetical protein n=1 Tax=Brotaphodocola sp. TaxID=3073577 RepID=UPI003D7D2F5F
MSMEMVMSGRLQCRVRARAKLMQYFLSVPEYRMALMERIGNLGIGEKAIPESVRCRFPGEIGAAVEKMAVLNEEELELAYDRVVKGAVLDAWLENQTLAIAYHSRKALELDQKSIVISIQKYLVYALVKNERCLKEIRAFREKNLGFSRSNFDFKKNGGQDQNFLAWFPQWQREDARWCMELLAQIRQDAPQKGDAYQMFWEIAQSGYRKMQKFLRQCDRMNGTVFAQFSSESDMALRISASVLGVAMAEQLGIPREEDFLFYTFLPVLQDYEMQMEECEEAVAVSAQGRRKCREMKAVYRCEDYVKSCLEHPLRDVSDEILRKMMAEEEGMETDDGDGTEMECDYREIFSIFHMNPRMLQGIQLTDQEMQKIFSLNADMEWSEYMPWLLAATLCKYIGKLTEYCERERLEQEQADRMQSIDVGECERLLRRLQELQKENADLKAHLEQMKQEKRILDQSLCQANQCLEQRKDQMEELRREQEQRGEELNQLRHYVWQMTESFRGTSGNSQSPYSGQSPCIDEQVKDKDTEENSNTSRCAENLRTILKGRRVIVIGGHVNWQKRFREQFPQWQFVAADKNNYDGESIRSKEVIIVNTAVLKHSCYYRVLAERGENQILLYVNGSNPERCMQELIEQLKCV